MSFEFINLAKNSKQNSITQEQEEEIFRFYNRLFKIEWCRLRQIAQFF
jgi:hypothetical protein